MPSNPVFLVRSDGHTVWVNKRALKRAGIGAGSPDPPGGRILRTRRTGDPSGILIGSAWERMLRRIPPLSDEERTEAVRLTVEIHETGSALITVTTQERAELYLEQVRSLARPRGFPLTATMEPE